MWLSQWEDSGEGYNWERKVKGGILRCNTEVLGSLKLAHLT